MVRKNPALSPAGRAFAEAWSRVPVDKQAEVLASLRVVFAEPVASAGEKRRGGPNEVDHRPPGEQDKPPKHIQFRDGEVHIMASARRPRTAAQERELDALFAKALRDAEPLRRLREGRTR